MRNEPLHAICQICSFSVFRVALDAVALVCSFQCYWSALLIPTVLRSQALAHPLLLPCMTAFCLYSAYEATSTALLVSLDSRVSDCELLSKCVLSTSSHRDLGRTEKCRIISVLEYSDLTILEALATAITRRRV